MGAGRPGRDDGVEPKEEAAPPASEAECVVVLGDPCIHPATGLDASGSSVGEVAPSFTECRVDLRLIDASRWGSPRRKRGWRNSHAPGSEVANRSLT